MCVWGGGAIPGQPPLCMKPWELRLGGISHVENPDPPPPPIYELTYPETRSPTSLINLCLLTNIFATLVQHSFRGFGSWQNILVARTRTISLRMEGTSVRLRSSSLFWLIHCIMEGGQESGILNSFDKAVADDIKRLSSDSLGPVMISVLIELLKGL